MMKRRRKGRDCLKVGSDFTSSAVHGFDKVKVSTY